MSIKRPCLSQLGINSVEMDDFLKFCDDPDFVQWIISPGSDDDRRWKEYFEKHPEEKGEAEKARLVISQLQSRREPVDPAVVSGLYAQIIHRTNERAARRASGRFLGVFLRYAAIFVFSLLLGGILVYIHFERQNLAVYKAVEKMHDQEEARLVLSDGQIVPLNQKESLVEYDTEGKIIINSRDTISVNKESSPEDVNQLIMPFGRNTSVLLPDGTRAYVNSGSRLVYPSVFRARTREVFLIGEAYFEVAPNSKSPFVVRTNYLNIVATGTVFNVSAYPADKFVETVLVEGKVILRENSSRLQRREIEMKPGEAVSYNRETMESATYAVNTSDYVTWHLGYLNFHSTDLNRVVVKLERYYNIRIYLDNPLLGMRRITGKLELRDDRQKVLEVLASTSQAELFPINENTYGLK